MVMVRMTSLYTCSMCNQLLMVRVWVGQMDGNGTIIGQYGNGKND